MSVYFTISYSYSQKIGGRWCDYPGNLVGRDGKSPIGYGPVGPGSIFVLDEVPEVVRVLSQQLGTTPTLTLHPYCGDGE